MYRHHFPSFATLYLGGGTPSLLTVGHIATLLNTAARVFTLSASLEITVEVNPADQDKLWLRELLRLGVSRIVLGVQSWDEGDIHFLGRRHTVLDAHRAVGMAREVGFPFLAFDLISGLPIKRSPPGNEHSPRPVPLRPTTSPAMNSPRKSIPRSMKRCSRGRSNCRGLRSSGSSLPRQAPSFKREASSTMKCQTTPAAWTPFLATI